MTTTTEVIPSQRKYLCCPKTHFFAWTCGESETCWVAKKGKEAGGLASGAERSCCEGDWSRRGDEDGGTALGAAHARLTGRVVFFLRRE